MLRHAAPFRMMIAALAIAIGAVASAAAQPYPNKPIRLIVPFGAGSTADVIARVIGNSIAADLGQSVVIDNRPGAGGTIGGNEAARAAKDGYTLVLGTVASHGVGPLTMRDAPYDPIKDFEPITMIANAPAIMVVHTSVPAKTLAEFVGYVKANPGLDYASAGTGTTTHLAGEALKLRADIKLTHVPYKAVGQALSDVVSGHIKMMVYQIPSVKPHIESGALYPIAVTTAEKVQSMPNVPTIASVYPGFDFSAWFGILAPAGTPKAITEQLHGAIAKAMKTEALQKQLESQGLEASGLGPDEFKKLLAETQPKWKAIIDATGTKAP